MPFYKLNKYKGTADKIKVMNVILV
uniref:Uncharacterized protein n=1 Tax=Anguilla anguilla TaxID=7936 RepID=A0A0E9RUZ3_ANGAN